jgi:hypothetical protein
MRELFVVQLFDSQPFTVARPERSAALGLDWDSSRLVL